MNFKKALLMLPVLAMSFAPALQARDHTEREMQRRAERAAEWRARHGQNNGYTPYYNNGSRYNPYYNGNAYRSRVTQQMDRNHDGVITAREREQFRHRYGYVPY